MKEKGVHYPGFIEYHPETGKYGGFLLDLPVFVAGKTSTQEAKKALEEGAKLYLAYLESEGKPAPEPGSKTPHFDEEVAAWLTPVSVSISL